MYDQYFSKYLTSVSATFDCKSTLFHLLLMYIKIIKSKKKHKIVM